MDTLDVIGVGIGPFNLSLAALIEPTPLRALFLEKRGAFCWHPGLALPNSRLQVSPFKDCVTLVNPTSPYSFLNYLAQNGRLYSFINKRNASTSRREFTDYYQWVSRQLGTVRFNEEVVDIAPFRDAYRVSTSTTTYLARAVVIAVGVEPKIPRCAKPLICATIYHAADYLDRDPPRRNEHVLVVGGGQSGAEIVEHMLNRPDVPRITWVTSRSNLFAMDDTSFVNEAYMPGYSRRFHALPLQHRRAIIEREKLTSDGISAELCNRLYDILYERDVEGALLESFHLLPSVVLKHITPLDKRWLVDLAGLFRQQHHSIVVDRIVLATGFQPRTPLFLQSLLGSAHMEDDLPVLGPDYAVSFMQQMPGPVYLQNQSRLQHGLQSANLSLVAYRNSLIINSLLGQPFYLDQSGQLLGDYESPDDAELNDLSDAMTSAENMSAIT
ncbi:SidA/IucD/PvdA family monooxygenase [Bradyrhizobium sp. CCGUVB1N3]|uniref:lysine N(6)-hydroxylase/L-ornithine N(5)-oxygenase family protein n=1 Tax=Bradyrhizobium sp. CCGUVB1N3 TaxID=2949629 RepID=UPI0020B2D6CE|nr:SidA/IucD/PvdA family monooxygenase [Bradyrhizobium sp. CCGUVB1N3]MCP3475803.1 SidA/IucD/PvdA family monooxygenase [Bradyrhizobium sp. CCGUVB1N3]